jgi:nucleoside phosphorylase
VIDAIFVPRGAEEGVVRRALRGHDRPAVWTSGIGPAAAARSVAEALTHGAPATALVTGLCGLLTPSYAVGDLLVYATLTRADGATLTCDADLAAQLAQRLQGAQTGIAAYASESIVARSADKRALAARSGVAAVDMESFAFVEGLQRAGTRVAVLRAGSDGAADDLPDLSRGVDENGTLSSSALALAMLSNPVAGVRMAANALRALRQLQRALRLIFATA